MNGSELTGFARFFMLLSITSVTLLVGYCYWRILSGSRRLDPEDDDRPD